MDCTVMDTPAHDVPSPYLDLEVSGRDAHGYDRAAVHTAAAERLARLGRWEQAYDHLRAAVRLLQGRAGPGDELDRLRREHAEARELSRRDSLTASYNRRYLDECLASLLEKPVDPAVRTLGLAVALIDIDHFKLVNDTYGHEDGDRVLCHVSDVIREQLREDDVACRLGGEEFVLLLRMTGGLAARAVANRLRAALASQPIAMGQGGEFRHVTLSAGVAAADERNAFAAQDILARADAALYRAKRMGRNRVEAE